MRRNFRSHVALAAAVASLLIAPSAFADAWHKYAKWDAFWHHGSGWIYPRNVGALELQGTPMQIDGNDDLTAEYTMTSDGTRRSAFVDVYFPDSAAVGAKLETARAAVKARAKADKDTCKSKQSEEKYAIDKHPEIVGTRIVFQPKSAAGCTRSQLYFFRSPDWVITVRTTASATDDAATKVLDEFVRALRWDTLGTDPSQHETPP